jgi:hypothetical protein
MVEPKADYVRTLILDESSSSCDREHYFCVRPLTEPWFEYVDWPNNGYSKRYVRKYSLAEAEPEWIRLAQEKGLLPKPHAG